LLGRIAGLINDPRRGLMDRTKNWSKERADMHRQQSLAKTGTKNPFRKIAQNMDDRGRRVKDRTGLYTQQNDNRYHRTGEFENIEMQTMEAQDNKQLIESQAQNRYGQSKLVSGRVRNLDVQMRNAKATLENTNKEADVQFENLKVAPSSLNVIPSELASHAIKTRQNTQRASILARQLHAAQDVQQEEFAKALIKSENLQLQSRGVDEHGADSALASAIATVRKSYNDSITEARAINKHFNLSSAQRQKHAMGKMVEAVDGDGNVRIFKADSIFTREAAIEDQVATATVPEVAEIVAASGSSLSAFRTSISAALASNGLGAKTLFLGGKTIDDVAQGKIGSQEDLTRVILETVAKGKISEKDLANIDKDAVQMITEATVNARAGIGPTIIDPALSAVLQSRITDLSKVAQDALTGDERVNIKPNSKDFITRLAKITDPTFKEAPLPRPLPPEQQAQNPNGPQGDQDNS